MYVWGGSTEGYVCDRSRGAACRMGPPRIGPDGQLQAGKQYGGDAEESSLRPDGSIGLDSSPASVERTSEELWRFDPLATQWEQLRPIAQDGKSMPLARERHGAFIWKGNMYVSAPPRTGRNALRNALRTA